MWNGYISKILVPVNYGMLAPNLQFMLCVCHGHSSSSSAQQIGKAKSLPQFQVYQQHDLKPVLYCDVASWARQQVAHAVDTILYIPDSYAQNKSRRCFL